MTLYANVTQIGSWNITTIASNGVTFSGSGTFTSLGCQPITLTASGTPTTAGPLTVNTNTSPVGTASTTVAPSTDPSSNGTATVSAYGGIGCTGNGILNGTYTVGQAVTSGNTLTFYANVTKIGTWNITTAANNGVTFSGSGTFTSTGCQPITLTASGTPTTAGSLIAVTNTSPSGTASTTVNGATSPSTNGTAVVSNYGNSSCANPSTGTINGNLTQGVPVSGVTMTLYANVTQVGSWSLSAVQNGVTFTGSGTFTSTGCQPITLNASGTPTATGTFTWTTNSSPQGSSPGTVSAKAPTNPIGAGLFSGKACFDVAISNDNANGCGTLSSRLAQKSDFTQAATNTQTYTFTPSGTVSNVRFIYVNTNGTAITALTGGNTGNNINSPVTATVTYASTLNTPATGLNNSNPITSDIYVVYNNSANNTGSDVQIKLTASIKDCACCGAFIAAGVWKDFLCHNLGANTTVDPHLPAVGIHGAHIQWGKRGPNSTGDSRVDWQTAANNGPLGFGAAPTPGNDNTVTVSGWSTTPAADYSWRTTAGAKTANDPCPSGYRVPTSAEWSGVTIYNTISRSGTWGSINTNYSSAIHYGPNASTKLLTLPAAGIRSIAANNGAFASRGSNGYYWSSNEGANSGPALLLAFINTDEYPLFTSDRLFGMSIRCIEDSDYIPVVPSASVGALNCSGATTTGILLANTAATNVSTSVPFTGGNFGTYSGQSVSSTGVTGLTAALVAGTLNGGTGNVTYTISGTPSGAGTANFAISLGGQSCTLTTIVNSQPQATFNCMNTVVTTNNWVLTNGTTYTGTISIPYTTGNASQSYPAESIISNGLTFSRTAGTYAVSGNIVYNFSGTYTGVSNTIFSINSDLFAGNCNIVIFDAIRGALATAGCASCTAYDAATVNDPISITKAEYDRVALILGASKSGLSDATIGTNSPNPQHFINGTFTSNSVQNTQIPASNYIMAFQVRTTNGTPSTMAGIQMKIATVHNGPYTNYGSTTLATSTSLASTNYFFVYKRPTAITASGSNSFFAFYVPVAHQIQVYPSSIGQFFSASGNVITGLNSSSSGQQTYAQFLSTATKQW
jgi:uncharacterized protein (TIGR02145 family)